MWSIISRLYIGDKQDSEDIFLLKSKRIDLTVNLANEITPKNTVIENIDCHLFDGSNEVKDIEFAVNSIVENYKAGKTLFVYCSGCLSRTPAITALALVKLGEFKTYEKAIKYIEKIKGLVMVHPRLERSIKEFQI